MLLRITERYHMCNNSDKILIKTPKILQITSWRTLLSSVIILTVTKDLNTLPEYCHSPEDYKEGIMCAITNTDKDNQIPPNHYLEEILEIPDLLDGE